MIKKLRSYLLEDESNRNSLSWYVVVIMIAPFIGVFFQYKKEKSVTVATVNGYELNKSIVRAKLYEQALLLERFASVFGKENIGYVIDMMYQGKKPEEFVMQNEIVKLYLNSLFEKYVGYCSMSEDFIFASLKKKNDSFLIMLLGDYIYSLICGKAPKGNDFQSSLDMNKIDYYCQYVVAGDCFKKILSLPLFSIYDVLKSEVNQFPEKVLFDVYECDISLRKYIEQIKRGVSEAVLQREYQAGIRNGLYRHDIILKGKVGIYTLDKEQSKDLSEDDFCG